jgi:hypothetical protein
MDVEAKLRLAREMLGQHMTQSLPGDETEIEGVDLVQVDASICNLVANMLRFDGDLNSLNEYYDKAGAADDFNSMILDVQCILDRILPKLERIELREYFARLSRMSIIAAEVGISQAVREVVIAGNATGEDSLRITADLDEGLRAFREQMAKQRPSKN